MSSFMKSGIRKFKLFQNKQTKKHIEEFYNIIGDIDRLSTKLKEDNPEVEFTEENIDSYINPIYGRDLDSVERMLLLGKLYDGKQI